MTLNRRFAIGLAMATLCGTAALSAQALKKAEVPFAFEVAGKKMQPGTYQASRAEGGAILVRNTLSREAAFVIPSPAGWTNTTDSSMTFTCYGSHCFLSKLQFGQSQAKYNFGPSRHEKELAAIDQPQTVYVAMR